LPQSGERIEQRSFYRARCLLSEIPGVEIDVGFAPGSQEGTADLVVMVRPGDVAQDQFAFAVRSLAGGVVRLSPAISLTLNNPAGLGDQLDASFSATLDPVSSPRWLELESESFEVTAGGDVIIEGYTDSRGE